MTDVNKEVAELVWNAHNDGNTVRQIASHEGSPSDTTVSRLIRARKGLQKGWIDGEIAQRIGWSPGRVALVRQWWTTYEASWSQSQNPRQEQEELPEARSERSPATADDIELAPRPQLDVSLKGLWPVISGATILSWGGYRPMGQAGRHVTVTAYRFKVSNHGGSAAEHAAGTLEFDSTERRICWYEGNVPYTTINAHDHSYLDVYGVILNPQNGPTTDIVMPTEHGWDNLDPRALTAPLEVSLRVTAANALPQTTRFSIDPTQGCRPIGR